MIYIIIASYLIGMAAFLRAVNFTGKHYGEDFFDDLDEHAGPFICTCIMWPVFAIIGLIYCFVAGKRIYFSPGKDKP